MLPLLGVSLLGDREHNPKSGGENYHTSKSRVDIDMVGISYISGTGFSSVRCTLPF